MIKNTLFYFLIFLSRCLWAQTPVIDITVPASACISEYIPVINNTVNANEYTWDFCIGDFGSEPVINTQSISEMASGYGFELIEDAGVWYGFAVDRSNKLILRYDYGDSPLNQPTIATLSLPAALFAVNPESISPLKFNNQWHAVVGYGANGGDIIRLDFGTSLSNNAPSTVNLGSFGNAGRIRNVKLVQESGNLILVLTNYGSNNLWRINYRNSFDNSIDPIADIYKTVSYPELSFITGMDINNIDGNFIVHAISILDTKIIRLNFGSSLLNAPTLEATYDLAGLIFSFNIKLIREGTKYYGYVTSDRQAIKLYDFGDLTSPLIPTEITYSGALPNVIALDMFKYEGRNYTYGVHGNRYIKVEHYYDCSGLPQYSSEASSSTRYSQSGDYEIDFMAYDDQGNSDFITKTISVTSDIAPTIDFSIGANQCYSSPISFTANSDQTISNWEWDFGDGNVTNIQNPVHTYAAPGNYEVTLNVVSEDGCTNSVSKNVQIFGDPVVSFTYDGGPSICTFEDIQFTSTSTIQGSSTSFVWDFGDGSSSIEENPVHSYTASGNYSVSLTLNEGGCTSTISQNVVVNIGPEVDFSVNSAYVNDPVNFVNLSSGDFITGYSWDFGDGNTSNENNPAYQYASSGMQTVQLTAQTSNGCDYSIDQQVNIIELPPIYFAVNASCIDEQITLDSMLYNTPEVTWDFCIGDFDSEPEVTTQSISEMASGYGFELIEDGGIWYGFVIDRTNKTVLRYDYGNSPLNDPIITVLSLPVDLFTVIPESISFIKFDDQWHAVVGYGGNGGDLIRLDFGASLGNNSPTSINIGNFGYTGRSRNVKLTEENGKLILVLSAYNINSIWSVNYRDSFDNPIDPLTDIYKSISYSDLQYITGIDIQEIGGNIIVHAISNLNTKVIRLNYGVSLLNTPTLEATYDLTGLNNSFNIKLIREGSNYYGYITSDRQAIKLYDFGDLLSPTTPIEITYSSTLPNVVVLDMFKYEGRNYVYGVNGSNYIELEHFKDCPASPQLSSEASPNILYSESGDYEIDFIAYDDQGNSDYITKQVIISSSLAPQIDTKLTGNCLDSPIGFSGQELSGTINTWSWELGDGSDAAIGQMANYQYTDTGTYVVKLNVTDMNGCHNFIFDTIEVYEVPVADFSFAGGIQCTNNAISFTNTSTGETGPIVSWTWNFDGTGNSLDKESEFTFAAGGDKNITLSASIPGCSSEISKIITITSAPTTNFSFDGTCEYEQFEFINNTSGEGITGYQWDFGDGYMSSNTTPIHKYEVGGNYVVGLTAFSSLGCNATLEKVVSVHRTPEMNFTNELACSDNSVTFFDQSSVPSANIVEQYWTLRNKNIGFEKTISGSSPSVLLEGIGEYEVTLIDVSNYGCRDTLVGNIEVHPSPIAELTIDNTCYGEEALFTQTSVLPDGMELASVDWLIDGNLYSNEEVVRHEFQTPGDYEVELYVRAGNFCPDSISKTLTINPLPEIDFEFSSNCEDQLVTIRSTTYSSLDPVSSYDWLINSTQVSSSEQFMYEFNSADEYTFSLGVTTENNCYTILSEEVTIDPRPRARFDVYPSYGATPLNVQFTDRSNGAEQVSYFFSLHNEEGSAEPHPNYVYHDIGEDLATQIVENEFGCSDTSTQAIEVVIPMYDISVSDVRVIVFEGKLKLLVGLQNNGTIIITNPYVRVDLAEKISLNQKIETTLMPGEYNEYEIDFDVIINTNEALEYVCFSFADSINNLIDVNPYDNYQCLDMNNSFRVLDPFPNPAGSHVDIPVILPSAGACVLQLVGENGNVVYYKQYPDLNAGLNVIRMELAMYQKGFYLLTVRHSDVETTKKIIIR